MRDEAGCVSGAGSPPKRYAARAKRRFRNTLQGLSAFFVEGCFGREAEIRRSVRSGKCQNTKSAQRC
jgi:hypothetical protein